MAACTVTNICCNAVHPGVMDHQFAPALPATQQPDQYSNPVARRTDHHYPLHIGVPLNDPLVALVILPGDITLMVIGNQYVPFLLRPTDAASNRFTAILNSDLKASSTICIGTGVDRVGEQPVEHTIPRRLPGYHP